MPSKYGFETPEDRELQQKLREVAAWSYYAPDREAVSAALSLVGSKVADILADYANSRGWKGRVRHIPMGSGEAAGWHVTRFYNDDPSRTPVFIIWLRYDRQQQACVFHVTDHIEHSYSNASRFRETLYKLTGIIAIEDPIETRNQIEDIRRWVDEDTRERNPWLFGDDKYGL